MIAVLKPAKPNANPNAFANRLIVICTMLTSRITALLIGIALFGMIFLSPAMGYACKVDFLLPNWLMLLFALVVLYIGIQFATGKVGAKLSREIASHQLSVDLSIAVACAGLLFLQLFICHRYAFVTDWDSGTITNDALTIVNGGGFSNVGYYSTYPNNLFLLWVAVQCGHIAQLLGITGLEGIVLVFSALNCIACTLSIWFLYRTISLLYSRAWGIAAWVIGVLIIWTSPWAGIMYSDAVVVCVPIMLSYLFIRSRKSSEHKCVVWLFLLGFLGILGYKIKPQVVFVLFAVAILLVVEFAFGTLEALRDRNANLCTEPASRLIAIIAGCVAAFLLIGVITEPWSSLLNQDSQFGIPHFLMMGLNPEFRGVFAQPDVDFSASFPDVSSRTAGNIQVILERVSDYGPFGLLSLFGDKLMTNFNDGTFAWGVEGRFFISPQTDPVGGLTGFIHSVYYRGGAYYDLWRTYAQFIWIAVLVCCFVGLLAGTKHHAKRNDGIQRNLSSDFTLVVSLALLMLVVFELLFEARARYLYSSVTLFIVMAVIGFRWLVQRIRTIRAYKMHGPRPHYRKREHVDA